VSDDVTCSGPIFDGRAASYCDDLADEIETELAAQFRADVMTTLNARIKHPTPYYETQIRVRRTPVGRVVDDSRVIYGPWLERGRADTRFRGYHAFKLAGERLAHYEKSLTVRVLRKWVRKL
jgi:hypothetical protein